MKVKITKCSGKSYWYFNLIGNTFAVRASGRRDYELLNKPGYYIAKKDCEVINEMK